MIAPSPDQTALRLLKAIYDKTGGRTRAVRDVAELETGLTADQAKTAWRELLDRGLIERFSVDYAARLSVAGLDFIRTAPVPSAPMRKLFLVRASDPDARDAVTRILAQAGLEAVLLGEEPGGSLMGQAEAHRDIEFALVLLTPDELRTPMNVLMEVGYFIGRLGPKRVRVIASGAPAGMPADLAGIPVVPLDPPDAWRSAVTQALYG